MIEIVNTIGAVASRRKNVPYGQLHAERVSSTFVHAFGLLHDALQDVIHVGLCRRCDVLMAHAAWAPFMVPCFCRSRPQSASEHLKRAKVSAVQP